MTTTKRRSRLRRWGKPFLAFVALLVVALVGFGVWIHGRLEASLPLLDGEVEVAGLGAPVTIERDGQGVPTIRAASRTDAARALGFLHGQERFFQMDLLRRNGAGEMAELFGSRALPLDRRLRVHRFRARAERAVTALPAGHRAVLEAYVEGVEAGRTTLGDVPPEYLLLRLDPEPWTAADSMLVLYAMYFDLQDETGETDGTRELLADTLGPEMAAFLDPPGSVWDAPLEGEPLADLPVPPPEAFDLRREEPRRLGEPHERGEPAANEALDAAQVGSNNFAVAGSETGHGGAIVVGDMHLGLRLPNIWYRAVITFPQEDGGSRRLVGVTLPGTPTLVSGSNGRIAWAFTNSYGDWTDRVELVPGPEEGTYVTAGGVREIERHEETLAASDGPGETLTVEETVFGPVVGTDHEGDVQVARWVAHAGRGADLALLHLEGADSLDEAFAVAHRTGMPAQNLMVADDTGRIGWTIIGPVPQRAGRPAALPLPSDDPSLPAGGGGDGDGGWGGFLPPGETPVVADPEAGYLWTANSRTLSGTGLDLLGDGGYALGARARQIRDGLARLTAEGPVDEEDLLGVQLDDRALFLARWRMLLLDDVLTPEAVDGHPDRAEARRLIDDWGGRASVGSAGYRLVQRIRDEIAVSAFAALLTPAARVVEMEPRQLARFEYMYRFRDEAPLWRLVTERPEHLKDPQHESWQEQLLAAVDAVLERTAERGTPLAAATWGSANRSAIGHPLSAALPGFLRRHLDAPPLPLAGDTHMPRVQGRGFGASQRMAVSPGREDSAVFHMPGGQSGHFLSPHYLAGHEDWAEGRPSPLLPGATEHTLTLRPTR